ncbi:MAG TPA: type I DNA topoisomerase [Thermohalobaculum sp.]|nr:type I DNA topoisomerase [Thermohalobaculum sp.]
MAVVVVESPAKARTINGYLGKDYTVLASYGHVRDLPAKDGSVDPEHGFEMVWEVDSRAQPHLRAIADALAEDNRLILATDPDREGEAISWHLVEALRRRRALKKDTQVDRVVFNAITRSAVTEAMEHPRQIDMPLVEAYLARRALDYLVGFTLSPVLWRKLPGAKSAGRVQSVALRLIVEREMEIEAFRPREYWSVRAILVTPEGETFEARLVALDGSKLDRFDLADEASARRAAAAIAGAALRALSVEAKPVTRNPYPPFMTSTLQQEASRKFAMGPEQTMRTAQRLYEAGHITYMRTDGLDMAPEAVHAARDAIGSRFGARYLPEKPRFYKSKTRNAQEAHECIRPTRMDAAPGDVRLAGDEARLYELIWQRTLASQMAAARFERTTVEIGDGAGRVGLRATGQVPVFDGFLRVYEEGRDDDAGDEESRRLPAVAQGTDLAQREVVPEQHFTQAPPRYTEATLIKRLEELGIGRPSTYASIIGTVQDRGYVRKEKGRLHPEDKGRLVTAFLANYFARYVSYDFTANMEDQLDEISGGRVDWRGVLGEFWGEFSAAVEETTGLRISEVLETIDEALAPHLFPDPGDGSNPRACPECGGGRLSLRTSRQGGAFIGCSSYPECRYTRPLAADAEGNGETRLLGQHEGQPVTLRSGPFGPYVQLGAQADGADEKPKRVSVPKGMDIDLDSAIALLSLPREIGRHPEDGEPVEAGVGRYGPYVRHGRTFASLTRGDDVLKIGMNRAVELLAQKAARRGGAGGAGGAKPLRELGEHPEGGALNLMPGRYGPYVKWNGTNATLPKGTEPESLTREQAIELVEAKRKTGKGKGGKAKTAKAKPAKAKPAKAKPAKAKAGKAKTARPKAGKAAAAPGASAKPQ